MRTTAAEAAGKRQILETLVGVFEEAGLPYCLLAGYDGYPDHIPSDIDFMVAPEWNDRLPALIALTAARSGAQLIQCLAHETTAAYFVLARLDGSAITWLHPDSSSDYRREGRVWLHASRVMARRRLHPRGFWVPAPADAFAYYLVKKLDKGSLTEVQAAELSRRYGEDRPGAARALRRLLPKAEAVEVEIAARSGNWRPVAATLRELRNAMRTHAAREPLPARLRQYLADKRRVLARLRHPTGFSIAFLGPDGSGKSSVIERVSAELAQAFRRVEYRHLRPPVFPQRPLAPGQGKPAAVVTDPHAQPARGMAGSFAKLLHFWSLYVLGGLTWLYPRRVRSTLVIFDRYYHDLLADPARYRVQQSRFLMGFAALLGHLLPRPDIVFILDAPAEVLQARKQEVSFAESKRQRAAYAALAESGHFHNVCLVDAAQPLETVVARILQQVVNSLELRAAHRLALAPGTPGKEALS